MHCSSFTSTHILAYFRISYLVFIKFGLFCTEANHSDFRATPQTLSPKPYLCGSHQRDPKILLVKFPHKFNSQGTISWGLNFVGEDHFLVQPGRFAEGMKQLFGCRWKFGGQANSKSSMSSAHLLPAFLHQPIAPILHSWSRIQMEICNTNPQINLMHSISDSSGSLFHLSNLHNLTSLQTPKST